MWLLRRCCWCYCRALAGANGGAAATFATHPVSSPPAPNATCSGQVPEASVFLFPGQGSQFVGMSQHLPRSGAVARLFDEASTALRLDLRQLCDHGPAQQLDSTRIAQPAVFVCSMAAVEWLRVHQPAAVHAASATAGLSLGELTALCFAGAVSFADALRLVVARGAAMQAACDGSVRHGSRDDADQDDAATHEQHHEPHGMCSVLLGADSQLARACRLARQFCRQQPRQPIAQPVCQTAIDLYSGCSVLAGHQRALQFVADNARTFRLRRVTPLAVSGGFHSPLMRPAVEPLRRAIANATWRPPQVPVYCNVSGRVVHSRAVIARRLQQQLTRRVCWQQTISAIYRYNKQRGCADMLLTNSGGESNENIVDSGDIYSSLDQRANDNGDIYNERDDVEEGDDSNLCADSADDSAEESIANNDDQGAIYNASDEVFVPHTYECGPGTALTTVLRRINGKLAARCHNIH